MSTQKPTRPTPNPDFTASVDSGLTESFEDYCTRTAEPSVEPEGKPNA